MTDFESFYLPIDHFYIFFCKASVHIFCPFLYGVVLMNLLEHLYTLWSPLPDILIVNILPRLWLPFDFITVYFKEQKL